MKTSRRQPVISIAPEVVVPPVTGVLRQQVERAPAWVDLRALLIDVDHTLICARDSNGSSDKSNLNTGSLLEVLQQAAVELGGMAADEAARRIEHVKRSVAWWHWSDFIVELELNPRLFWEYAYEVESRYIQPTGLEIRDALERLRDAGLLLYITSNNPSSGILHKLRLAGLGHVHGSPLFSQLLGGTELHAMKADAIYWKKALAHIGLDADQTAVIGDNLHDDFTVPRSIGIRATFLIDRWHDRSEQDTEALIHVRDFTRIADIIQGRKP